MKLYYWTIMLGLLFSACKSPIEKKQPTAMENQESLKVANDQLYHALNLMFKGEIEPINSVWSHSDEITYMGPFGGMHSGWDEVGTEFANVAALKIGGKITSENLVVRVLGDVGYTVCVEAGENMDNQGNPVPVHHRATNVFKRENGGWKLVHHHTDISGQLQESTGISD
jgi:ketosteroid isomerase-like protein